MKKQDMKPAIEVGTSRMMAVSDPTRMFKVLKGRRKYSRDYESKDGVKTVIDVNVEEPLTQFLS